MAPIRLVLVLDMHSSSIAGAVNIGRASSDRYSAARGAAAASLVG